MDAGLCLVGLVAAYRFIEFPVGADVEVQLHGLFSSGCHIFTASKVHILCVYVHVLLHSLHYRLKEQGQREIYCKGAASRAHVSRACLVLTQNDSAGQINSL